VAEIIWTDPALDQLEEIADYIALDKPEAAAGLVRRVFTTVDRLEQFPDSGHVPSEVPNSIYREVLVSPCRIFYRRENGVVFIVHVMREEMLLRKFLLGDELNS
jgi:plasmid stabilization system protein ParE